MSPKKEEANHDDKGKEDSSISLQNKIPHKDEDDGIAPKLGYVRLRCQIRQMEKHSTLIFPRHIFVLKRHEPK